MDNLVETMVGEFRAAVGEDRVILALSGGVILCGCAWRPRGGTPDDLRIH